mgnify:CR=1 FL=1
MEKWENLEKRIDNEIIEYSNEIKLFQDFGINNPKNQMSKIDYEAEISLYKKAVRIQNSIQIFNSEFPDSTQNKDKEELISE